MPKKMFETYIQQYAEIYGRHSIGSNVHILQHITEDMTQNNVGNLMDISTYKYENTLRNLGFKVKHCNLPLEQVARRVHELSLLQKTKYKQIIHEQVKEFIPQMHHEVKFENQTVYNQMHLMLS